MAGVDWDADGNATGGGEASAQDPCLQDAKRPVKSCSYWSSRVHRGATTVRQGRIRLARRYVRRNGAKDSDA